MFKLKETDYQTFLKICIYGIFDLWLSHLWLDNKVVTDVPRHFRTIWPGNVFPLLTFFDALEHYMWTIICMAAQPPCNTAHKASIEKRSKAKLLYKLVGLASNFVFV